MTTNVEYYCERCNHTVVAYEQLAYKVSPKGKHYQCECNLCGHRSRVIVEVDEVWLHILLTNPISLN